MRRSFGLLLAFSPSLILAAPVDRSPPKLDPVIEELIDPELMPERKDIPDKENAFVKLTAIVDMHGEELEKLHEKIQNIEASIPLTLAQQSLLLRFRDSHQKMRTDYFKALDMQCLVPDTKDSLVHNSVGYQNLQIATLMADSAYIGATSANSAEILEILKDHLKAAKTFSECEGETIQSILSVALLGRITDYALQFAKNRKLSPEDVAAFIAAADQIELGKKYITDLLKREYFYMSIRTLNETPHAEDIKSAVSDTNRFFHRQLDRVTRREVVEMAGFDGLTEDIMDIKTKLVNAAIYAYINQTGTVPDTSQDLITAKLITKIPKAELIKKEFVYDEKSYQVMWKD
jgi:hypothetical protein